MIEYITAQDAANKWGITVRRVQVFCNEGRIPGALKHASVWAIPKSAEKPNRLPSGPKQKNPK
ncbi:DNA-binding protein [Sporomusa sphaeroides]|jgi:hypothetical protein|uniref:DNA-binding protein n=1 Tax=Sporomusa sphaeroides TaxID=47679 RepID=UPI002549B357|nr:DNA-binding protein [Sporomusa sphaeroides]